jgi:hypothetical protein
MDFKVRTVTCVHRNRDNRQHLILVRTVRILSVRTIVLWHKFRGGTDSRTQAVPYGFRTGPYSPFLAQKSRHRLLVWFFWKVWHSFQGSRTTINAPRNLLKQLARISRHPYNHFGGTEIEEQTCNLLQKILERVLRSLAHFPVKTWHGYRDKFVIKFLKMNML